MTVPTTWIIGGGGHAHVIASFLDRPRILFVVPKPEAPDQVNRESFFGASHDPQTEIFIGVGDNEGRTAEYNRIKAIGLTVARCIAPNAFVARDAELGEGAMIGAGAVVGTRARVGANTIVNTMASVDHDCVVGDHSQLSCAVTLGGHVTIGTRCFLGMKSAVFNNLTIGNDVVVMGGALVTKSLPDSVVAGGTPAHIIRSNP